MRLIDAYALKEEISRIYYVHYAKSQDKTISDFFNAVAKRIKGTPTVDAEPVRHGRWVDHMVRDWRCSECGEKIQKVRKVDGYCYDDKPNYCPNCGAKMDNEEESCATCAYGGRPSYKSPCSECTNMSKYEKGVK